MKEEKLTSVIIVNFYRTLDYIIGSWKLSNSIYQYLPTPYFEVIMENQDHEN